MGSTPCPWHLALVLDGRRVSHEIWRRGCWRKSSFFVQGKTKQNTMLRWGSLVCRMLKRVFRDDMSMQRTFLYHLGEGCILEEPHGGSICTPMYKTSPPYYSLL
jgi:hypothetical protein